MASKVGVVSPHEIEPESIPLKDRSANRLAAPTAGRSLGRYAEWLWMAAILGLFALHAVHLRADFPNYSPWMDYAKYTDEGWYGNAAIEAFVRGSWYVPGDFNSAVALPVLPFVEWLLFHFTGVSIAAARGLVVAIFGANLLLMYALVRTSQSRWPVVGGVCSGETPRWPSLLAVTLVASSGFLYCFGRLAILEPLVVFFLLASWLLALRTGPASSPLRRTMTLAGIGIALCLMVLTKTTAVVVLPSVLYMVWRLAGDLRQRLKACATVAIAALLPWAAYYFLLVRPNYLADYRYLFTANVYQQPTTSVGWVMAFWYAVHGGLWIDGVVFIVAAALLLLSATLMPGESSSRLGMRALWRNPVYVAAVMAVAFQVAFIGYHNNMQPRYYMVAAYPLFILIALTVEPLLRLQRLLGSAVLVVIVATVAFNAYRVFGYVRHPQYTFVNAAENLTRYIDRHPNGNRLLLSISGNEIGLVTGLPAICDDFGTMDLPTRIHLYQPGWYAAWNELDPGTLEDLHTQFRLEEVANFHAFDDEDRNVLVLYKLHPLPLSEETLSDTSADEAPVTAVDTK